MVPLANQEIDYEQESEITEPKFQPSTIAVMIMLIEKLERRTVMLEKASRVAIIVIAVCLSFNFLRDLYVIFIGTATAQSTYSVPTITACVPRGCTFDPTRILAVPVVQVPVP